MTQGLDTATIQQASDRGAGSVFRVHELEAGCFYAAIHAMGDGVLFAMHLRAWPSRFRAEADLAAIRRWLVEHPGDVRDALVKAGWEVVG